MKYIFTFFICLVLLGCSTDDNSDTNANNQESRIYFENGICKCPGSSTGFTQVLDGIEYKVVDNNSIRNEIQNGNFYLCISNVTSLKQMLSTVSLENVDISYWDTSNVTNMEALFYQNGTINQNLSRWDTSSVTKMNAMFAYATRFNQPLN